MHIGATFIRDNGQRESLGPGAIIGRMPQASLRVDDPRISEAHALVSLRGAQLKLLALRGRLSVDGKPRTDTTLTPGLRITLAGFYRLTVESVVLPDQVFAIALDQPPHDIIGAHGVVAIFPRSHAPLRVGYDPEAAAHVWTRANESLLRTVSPQAQSEQAREEFADHRLVPGASFVLDGVPFSFRSVARDALDAHTTTDRGRDETRLKLVLCFDSVHIHGSDGRSVTVDGIAARLLCELYEIGSPVAWQEVANLLWPADTGPVTALRQRWDQLLTRLRMRLREAGVRSDLVRPSQRGLVELLLGPDDVVEDQT